MRPFSGRCPRKSRTAARTPPRGTPKCSGLFPLPLAASSSSSCLLFFSLSFASPPLFFFSSFLRYFGRALNAFTSAASAASLEHAKKCLVCVSWLRGRTGVSREDRCLIAGGSGIILFHGLTPPSGLTPRSIWAALYLQNRFLSMR